MCSYNCYAIVFGMANQYTVSQVDTDRLEAYYASGMTQLEIAPYFEVNQQTISKWFKKYAIKARVAKKRNQWGTANGSWKGDHAGYAAAHARLKVIKGSADHCEECGATGPGYYDWANLTGNYLDIEDYKQMCRSCHAKYDNKVANLNVLRRGL